MTAQFFNGSVVDSLSDFRPSDAMGRADGDIVIYFLSGSGVLFSASTEDAWYRATVPERLFKAVGDNAAAQSYHPEEAASPLGCVQQFQFCNPALPRGKQCGPLGSWRDATLGAATLFDLTAEELMSNSTGSGRSSSQFLWWTAAIGSLDPSAVVRVLGPQALISVQSMFSGVQAPLPTNQWQIDVAHWWSISMAILQDTGPRMALGWHGEASVLPPQDKYQEEACRNQVRALEPSPSVRLQALPTQPIIVPLSIHMKYPNTSNASWFPWS